MHWDARRYLQQHGFIIERGQALVDLLAPRAGERILDLACGTGDIARAAPSARKSHRGCLIVHKRCG